MSRRFSSATSLAHSAMWLSGACLVFWSFGYTCLRGSDLWWHLAAGRWILEHRSVPRADFWSFTRDGQPWRHHEWLSDLIYGLWVRLFGMTSLVYWKWALVVGAFLLLMEVLARITRDRTSSFLAVLLALATAAPLLDIRPHLYSLLGFAALLVLALVRPRLSWILPGIFFLWANLHGGFFFGLLALGPLLAIAPGAGGPRPRQRLLLWLACAGASLATPNGIHGFVYPLGLALRPESPIHQLSEWLPPFSPGALPAPAFPAAAVLFFLASTASLLSPPLRRQRPLLAGLALGALTLAMSLKACRFIPLFGMAQSLALAPVLSRVLTPILRRIPILLPPLAACLLGAVWLVPYPLGPRAFPFLTLEETFPVDTCDFIEANRLSGKVFDYYGWGGYIDLRTGGRLKVYIDGRADTLFDDETCRRYLVVLNEEPGWEGIIDASGADFVLWPTEDNLPLLQRLVDSGRWRLLHQDFVSVLLVRAERVLPAPHDTPEDSAYRHLSLGGAAMARGFAPEAERHFRRALELQPDLNSAAIGVARALMLQGDRESARRTLREMWRRFPSPEVRMMLKELG